MRWLAFVLSTLILAAATAASAAVITVDVNGTGDFMTLQEGVAAAAEGDTVLVKGGTYSGPMNRDIDLGGINIYIFAESGPDFTTLDLESSGRAFIVENGESWRTQIEGFTIINGDAYEGGAIYCKKSAPVIYDCVFGNNSAEFGGAIFCGSEAEPDIEDCYFEYNTCGSYGGAIYAAQAMPVIYHSYFTGNTAGINGGGCSLKFGTVATFSMCTFRENSSEQGGAAYCGMTGVPDEPEEDAVAADRGLRTVFKSCKFFDNEATRGGGVFINGFSEVAITYATFAGNTATDGGGVYCLTSYSALPSIYNCTFVANAADHGAGVYSAGGESYNHLIISNCIFAFSTLGTAIHRETGSPLTTTLTLAYMNAGGDELLGDSNLSVDPNFCDMSNRNFFLCEDSPCLSENNEYGALIGAYRALCGPCGSAVETMTWGSIKAMYR